MGEFTGGCVRLWASSSGEQHTVFSVFSALPLISAPPSFFRLDAEGKMVFKTILGNFFCVIGEKVIDLSLKFENMVSKKNVFINFDKKMI